MGICLLGNTHWGSGHWEKFLSEKWPLGEMAIGEMANSGMAIGGMAIGGNGHWGKWYYIIKSASINPYNFKFFKILSLLEQYIFSANLRPQQN